MDYWIIYLSGLFFLIIGSYSDCKKKEVDNYIPYSMIGLGLILRLYFSIIDNNYDYIITGLLTTIIFFGLGAIIYYLNGWGGADAKMLSGVGATLGWHTFEFLFILSIIAIPIYIIARYKKKDNVAFIPAFLFSYILIII